MNFILKLFAGVALMFVVAQGQLRSAGEFLGDPVDTRVLVVRHAERESVGLTAYERFWTTMASGTLH